MSDGIVFLARVFLSALWFGRPHLISIITVSSFSRRRKGGTVYFSWALRIPTHIRDNASHLQDAQFVGSQAKHKCFSLASFDVNHCVLSAFEIPHGEREREQASDKAHMDGFLRSSNIADSKRLMSARGTRLMMAVIISQPVF